MELVANGIDDAFVANVPIRILKGAEAIASIEESLKKTGADNVPNVSRNDSPYHVREGVTFRRVFTNAGERDVALGNFEAKIVREDLVDDGVECRIVYEISGKNCEGIPLPPVRIGSESFSSLSWVNSKWGSAAIINAGQSNRDHLRAAIQSGSAPVKETRFACTGWRRVDRKLLYLHSGGALSESGPEDDVRVDLSETGLENFFLPKTNKAEIAAAVRSSLRIFDLAPACIAFPIFIAPFRAALIEILPLDFGIFFTGITGVFKSEASAISQRFFGPRFTARNLPGNWASTDNALEKQISRAKDAIFTIDDFCPSGTSYDVARLHQKAERIFRGQGNGTAKDRMNADGSLRKKYVSRSLIISSGEEVPKGHSLRARLLVVPISKGDIAPSELTELQNLGAEGVFARAMSGFVQYLAPRMAALKSTFEVEKNEFRKLLTPQGEYHARLPDMLGHLMATTGVFSQFATSVGVEPLISNKPIEAVGIEACGSLIDIQDRFQKSANPADRCIENIRAIFTMGRGHLRSSDRGVPDNCELWGWAAAVPRGDTLGWLNGNEIYFEPDALYKALQVFSSDTATLSLSREMLWKNLESKGKILRPPEDNRFTFQRPISGKRRRVLIMPVSAVYSDANGESGETSGD